MEKGELQRSQRALEQWAQEHPEEVRRLRELAKPLAEFLNSPEWDAFWQPAKAAILDGDEDGIYAWAEERIGGKPDFVIKVAYLGRRALGDATPRETWELIDARAQRLGEPDEEAIAAFVENTKKYPRLARALRESDRPDLEIAGAIWMASGESPYGYPLSLGEIEWRIERDPPSTFDRRRGNSAIVKDARAQVRAAERRAFEGQLRPEEHKEAMRALLAAEEQLEDALKHASEGQLEDTLMHAGEEGEELRLIDVLPEGERYRGVWLSPGAGGGMLPTPEWEERLLDRLFLAHYADAQNPAGLSPSELEVFQLARGLEHWEISEKIGRTVNQVRQFKHHAVRKVREHGGIHPRV